MRVLISILLSTFFFSLSAQSDKVFTLEEFITIVKENHPTLKQIDLLERKSRAYERKAKGGIDPTISMDYDKKSFDDKNYFNKYQGVLKIPTWYGIDFEAGYDFSNGDFLNSELTLPENGLAYAGVRIPLGAGLLFNERRKILEESKIIAQLNTVNQVEIVNKVLSSAYKAYINWFTRFQEINAFQKALTITDQNFDNISASVETGLNPAVDTLEYRLSLLTRGNILLKSKQDFFEATQKLSTFLWREGVIPLELEEEIIPEDLSNDEWEVLVAEAIVKQEELIARNPTLARLDLENDQLALEQRIQKEFLKPQLNVKLNPLVNVFNNQTISYSPNDFKIGADFYYPLNNRKTKASLQLAEIDIENNLLDKAYTERSIQLNLRTHTQALNNLELLLARAQQNQQIATQLLEVELEKFSIGESSVFLLNTRETKLVEYQLKVLELRKKIFTTRVKIIETLQLFTL